jgi:3-dehydroquinate synthase
MAVFAIHGVEIQCDDHFGVLQDLVVHSVPRPYSVTFNSGDGVVDRLCNEIQKQALPLLLVDKWVFDHYLSSVAFLARIPRIEICATEDKKNIYTALEIVEFFEKNGASKASMVFAVGGGIIQDLAAFSAYLYKRGIPWTFVPTTLLAQCDSSVGGKTALNHFKTKNLLALFSAPRRVITDTGFLNTLTDEDWLSGGGEILRLCITGGESSLQLLEDCIDTFVLRDLDATTGLLRASLLVKKAVVEFDEFEIDIRRSMNYGHSIGHALEALTDYRIAHGLGVALGVLVENEISYLRGVLPGAQRDRILVLAEKLISSEAWQTFRRINMDGVIDILRRDKKVEGAFLKLATLKRIGEIEFVNLSLNDKGLDEVTSAYSSVVQALGAIRNV